MTIMKGLQSFLGGRKQPSSPSPAIDNGQHRTDDKEAGVEMTASAKDDDEQRPDEHAQPGVQKIEAVTLTWSKNAVYLILVLIWFLTLVNNMKTSIVYSLTPYATSSFAGHSLLTVIGIVASSMAGAVYIPMAKALDLWGRAEGFLVMTVFCMLGIVLLAVSTNIQTYSAGEVFYTVGFGGLSYSWVVLAADVTSLRNRGLAFAFTSSPAIISAFAGSKAAAQVLHLSTWRWGYGMWAIILPVFAMPVYFLLSYHMRKAEKNGTLVRAKRNWAVNLQSIRWVVVEFDCKWPSSSYRTSCLLMYAYDSAGRHPLRRWNGRLPPSIHPRRNCTKRLEHRLYYRHDRGWLSPPRILHSLRDLLGTGALLEPQNPHRPDCNRSLWSQFDLPDLLRMLRQLLLLVSPGCVRSRCGYGGIHWQHPQRRIFRLPLRLWRSHSMDWTLQMDLMDLRATIYSWSGPDDSFPHAGRVHWLHCHVRNPLLRCWKCLYPLLPVGGSGLGRSSARRRGFRILVRGG
ncbi:Siderophore iron transporter mirB [Cercospora beticola]|uniref:Siderophore iron transporter mirB n=1 Tax=Cercospora beticola TaxID=122368 RepID=A0A2G5IB83_CERBT|nr:Siderophore iron transporter mirB [Cercospora beticola]PIB02107.1 Siderophore iron transporter mirB [Cercospora beticola]